MEEAGYDYVVINDGSTDDTLRVVAMRGLMSWIYRRILALEAAVQAGHKYANALAMM